MSDCEITHKDSWRRFNGAWKWGVAIPNGDETIRIVCPKCGSANARSDRISPYVYGWCTKVCGWEDARRITINWEKELAELRSVRHKLDLR